MLAGVVLQWKHLAFYFYFQLALVAYFVCSCPHLSISFMEEKGFAEHACSFLALFGLLCTHSHLEARLPLCIQNKLLSSVHLFLCPGVLRAEIGFVVQSLLPSREGEGQGVAQRTPLPQLLDARLKPPFSESPHQKCIIYGCLARLSFFKTLCHLPFLSCHCSNSR